MLKSWLSQIGLSLVQALRITSQEFRSNFLFWQIARAATNFLFSTGLTKSTRQSGKHERVHGQTEFDKKAQLSLQSDFFSGLRAVVESGGWSGLNIIYQIFGHLAVHLGRARGPPMIYGILAYRSILRRKLDQAGQAWEIQ